MAAPVIVSVRNTPADGLSVAVTLQDDPTPPIQWYASKLPGLAGQPGTEVVAATGGGLDWVIQIRDSAEPTPVRYGYYVAVEDADGLSEEEAEWVCSGTALDLRNQIEGALHDLIADNEKLLNRSLQILLGDTLWPSGEDAKVLRVHRGYPVVTIDNEYPIVSVRIHDMQDDLWFGQPRVDAMPVSGTIYVYLFHQGRVEMESVVAAIGMGVFNVLNEAHNLEMTLDCGLVPQVCHCETIQFDEEYLGGKAGYMAVAEILWKCQVFIGKEGHL